MMMNRQENDIISRQSLIRWIETECNPYGKPTIDYKSGIKVIKHLERIPSAQPEIIRCGECKYYRNSNETCDLIDTRLHFYETDKVWSTDCFCAWGERRTDE